MKKNEFVELVRECGEFEYKTEAAKAVDAVLCAVETALKKGEKVSFVGFGSFEVVEKAERQVRNPKTGEITTVPAHKSVKFKAGSKLKEAIN